MELHLISIASLKPWFLSKLHGASAGLKIAIPLPDTTPLTLVVLVSCLPLGSSISGLAESTAAANRLHAISIFPEYHMELHLISIASLKPWFLSKLHGASAGLKIAIPLPDTTPCIREWLNHLHIWSSFG
ncbi:DNA mismatch repair protein MutS [Trichinella spiralis]|uniref:DNA mismatch repair protein MutS n=1 Tax=Trichinella spiralis TaxID=6334 RepID=A0ABR3K2H6_TRISP